MSGPRFDLVVLGDCCPDIVLSANSVRPRFGQAETLVSECRVMIGGSGTITACRAAELGMSVALVAVVGDDLFGRDLRQRVASYGVDVSALRLDQQCPTGVTVVLNEPTDRAMLTAPGGIDLLTSDDVPQDLLSRACHIHVSSYFLQLGLRDGLGEILGRARDSGATTSLDTNWDPEDGWEIPNDLLHQIDVLSINAAEACRLAGMGDDVEQAAQSLARSVGIVIVKQGSAPALAVARGAIWRASPPTVAVVDTIGAGDSFNAGFLSEWLATKAVGPALALACAVGSVSTTGRGGTGASIDPDRARSVAGTVRVVSQMEPIALPIREAP